MHLATILKAGSRLVDSTSSNSAPDLKAVLLSRLAECNRCLGRAEPIQESITLEEAQLETAQCALYIVEQVQNILAADSNDTSRGFEQAPAIGTRDLAQLRTLLQIVFKWGIDILLPRVASAWPSKPVSSQPIQPAKVTTISSTPEDYIRLSSLTSRLIRLLFPGDKQVTPPKTLLTTAIVDRHLADLLNPCISLGWLPKSMASESTPILEEVRQLVIHLLSILSPSQTISALGSILSNKRPLALHTHRSCASFLTRQLLRPDGIRGLCDAFFGDEDTADAPLEKLERASQILSTVPAAMKPEEYFGMVSPRIVTLLAGVAPPSHKRAVAFALSRMLAPASSFTHRKLVSTIILPILHKPFLELPFDPANNLLPHDSDHLSSSVPSDTTYPSPRQTLSTLMTILINTDPAPLLISTLLSPILSPLYAILFDLDRLKTSDPELKESLRGILTTWGRVVGSQEVVSVAWTILDNEGGEWEIVGEGELKRHVRDQSLLPLSFLTPEDLHRAETTEGGDFDLNLLNLRPDPIHFVRFITSFDRPDIYSDMFVRLLEAYRETKTQSNADPLRALLYLQLVIQMQTQLMEKNESSSILRKPEHILLFVKHVLQSAVAAPPDPKPPPRSKAGNVLRIEDLRILPEEDQHSFGDDSDDESSATVTSDDHVMTETAISLLLSVLEAHGSLSADTTPVLGDIFDLLGPVASNISHPARMVAREARMTITARLASTSTPRKVLSSQGDAQETYQKALRLLQDPILPVRAHGLLLLRQVITSPSETLEAKRSLVPAILSVFLQCIQDDDSYMFLNAVQGLAALVDKFGKDVLKSLIDVYARGLNGSSVVDFTQHEVDVRLRVGEALGQIIRRCGQTLGIHVHLLVPSLFNIIKSPSIPTTLRSSSLSLLAECENTSSLSLLPYSGDLFEATIDLLQVETVSGHREKTSSEGTSTEPTSTNSKLPPLRRAALHFLMRIIQQATARVYDSGFNGLAFGMKRAHTTIAYVASTDEDPVVRIMAREASEALKDLGRAILGV